MTAGISKMALRRLIFCLLVFIASPYRVSPAQTGKPPGIWDIMEDHSLTPEAKLNGLIEILQSGSGNVGEVAFSPDGALNEIGPDDTYIIAVITDRRTHPCDDHWRNLLETRIASLPPGDKLRGRLMLAVGKLGDEAAIPTLIHLLSEDSDPQIRAAAAMTLGNLKAKCAIPELTRALNDSSAMMAVEKDRPYLYSPVRRTARDALKKLGVDSPENCELLPQSELIAMLDKFLHGNESVGAGVPRLLWRLHDPEAKAVLRKFVKEAREKKLKSYPIEEAEKYLAKVD